MADRTPPIRPAHSYWSEASSTYRASPEVNIDRISLGDYLRAFVSANANPVTGAKIEHTDRLSAADLNLIGFDCGRSDFRASLAEVIRDHQAIKSHMVQIEFGMDRLPWAFAPRLPENPGFGTARACQVVRTSLS